METAVATWFFAACLLLWASIMHMWGRERRVVEERIKMYTAEGRMNPIQEELSRPIGERILAPLWKTGREKLARVLTPERKSNYEKMLVTAGKPWNLTPEDVIVAKYGSLALFLLLGLAFHSLVWAAVLGGLGYLLPDMGLKWIRSKREEAVVRALPDVLDLLTVSVEAGLGFDAAMQKVVEKSRGPLAQEFTQVMNEVKMGKPRREALKDMAERVEVEDVSTFVGAVVQAEQLGVSIANVLKVQADQVRVKRRQRAEEKAQKAPVKILFPLLLFIFPSIFLILLGPAVIQLMETFK